MTTLHPETTRLMPLVTYPTADAPERGEIRMGGIVLSDVAYWQEDGLHVFRSLEYDVIAAHEHKQTAVRMFVDKSEDYARFIAEGDPPAIDVQIAFRILSRLVDAYESREERDRRRRKVVRLLRGRGDDAARAWYHRPEART